MSVIFEYAFRSDGLVLARAVAGASVRLDVERITATEPDRPTLFVWAEGDDLEAFDGDVARDPTVTDVQVLSEVDDKRLYSMQVTDATEVVLYPEWVQLGGEGLHAYHESGWWRSRIRFPDRIAVQRYRDFLEECGVEFRLKRLYSSDEADGPDHGMTAEQRETLKLAYGRGFFDVPRQVNTTELAAELGVSDQAVSERLRRGYARLVEHVVGVEPE